MALIIPPGFLHAVYQLTFFNDSEVMVTTCGHELDSASGASTAQSADDLFASFAANVMPKLTTDMTLVAVTTYVGQDGSGPLVVESGESPVLGGLGGTSLPPNCAILTRKRTDAAGRRGRGRMYVPGVDRTGVEDNGNLDTTYRNTLQTAFNDWYDDLTAMVGGRLYPPVVLHRSEGIGVEPLPTPITQFVVEGKIATQRRRLRP